jgi:hypothetical protein
MAPSTMASQSSALHDQAINCRSTLLSFIRHSSLPAVAGHSCFVICSSLVCIRAHWWLAETPKSKNSVDTFQRIPLKGQFTSGPPRE